MSEQAKQNLAPAASDKNKDAKRKMTAAIIEDEKQRKEVYEFLEDDDDFEEFELNPEGDIDVEMQEETDRKQWYSIIQSNWCV